MSDVDEAFTNQLRAKFRALMTGKLPPRAVEMTFAHDIAVIPVCGEIAFRADAVLRAQAGTSVEHVARDVRLALANAKVKAIVLDIASGGGKAEGIDSLGDELRIARTRKPIVAFTDSIAASAAYQLAAQASRIFASETARIGSIGCAVRFFDQETRELVVIKSAAEKRWFERCDAVSAGERLMAAIAAGGTIPFANRAVMQRLADEDHELFCKAIAAGRGIHLAVVRRSADGRLYEGIEALERGLIDGIATRAQAIEHARRLASERTYPPAALAGNNNDPPAEAG